MITKTEKEYWTVWAESLQVEKASGGIMTEAGRDLFLCSEEGYWQWSSTWCDRNGDGAYKFKKKPTLELIKSTSGMPWFYEIDPTTIKIYHHQKETIIKSTKELVS